MKIGFIAVLGAASLAAAANAGFTGWVGKVRDTGTHYIMDVYAGMSSSTDKLLNVFNANIAATNGAAFLQGATAGTNKWRPTLGVANMDDVDSFVTLGGFDDGGLWYCGDTTTADPNFTNYATSNATTIAANAGWYSSDPTSSQIVAVSLAGLPGATAVGSANASFGVWVAHFTVLKNSASTGGGVSFNGSAAFNTGTNAADQRTLAFAVPGPGALALLGVAGLASRRRRA
jgi:MYXO-CTERM domain-containing protein